MSTRRSFNTNFVKSGIAAVISPALSGCTLAKRTVTAAVMATYTGERRNLDTFYEIDELITSKQTHPRYITDRFEESEIKDRSKSFREHLIKAMFIFREGCFFLNKSKLQVI